MLPALREQGADRQAEWINDPAWRLQVLCLPEDLLHYAWHDVQWQPRSRAQMAAGDLFDGGRHQADAAAPSSADPERFLQDGVVDGPAVGRGGRCGLRCRAERAAGHCRATTQAYHREVCGKRRNEAPIGLPSAGKVAAPSSNSQVHRVRTSVDLHDRASGHAPHCG